MKLKQLVIILIFLIAVCHPHVLLAQTSSIDENIDFHTTLRLPVVDSPYNTDNGYTFPSMTQSLMISKDTLQLTHEAVWEAASPAGGFVQWVALVVWDYFLFMLPGGNAWVHEEWHRAVMGQYGIESRNDVYNFDLGAVTIAVSHVKDNDLIWLKENHNPDMVRLMEAGNEAEIQLSRVLRRESFFTGRPVFYELPALWFSLVNESFYVFYCSTKDADRDTEEFNEEDGSNIKKRDFTGLDFTAWIYDLNRPGERYSGRGVHPSGTGIDRYVKYSDLTDSERRYLRMTGWLTLFNFISPQLIGYEWFRGNDPFTGDSMFWNFMVLHNLTSFGNDISVNFLMQEGELNLELALHTYFNKEHYSPGIEAGIYRYPVNAAGKRIYCNAGVLLFMQPEDQSFHTAKRETGTLVSAGIDIPLIENQLELYAEADAKTDGWIAGNVCLEKQLQGRCGVNFIY